MSLEKDRVVTQIINELSQKHNRKESEILKIVSFQFKRTSEIIQDTENKITLIERAEKDKSISKEEIDKLKEGFVEKIKLTGLIKIEFNKKYYDKIFEIKKKNFINGIKKATGIT